MTTDTTERGLERLICTALTGAPCDAGTAQVRERPEGFTRTVLFAHKLLSAMDKPDRIRACYLHACLCYVMRQDMTNTTLRKRFGVDEHNRAAVSRIIREAVGAGAIVPADADAAPKLMRYLPQWAAPTAQRPE